MPDSSSYEVTHRGARMDGRGWGAAVGLALMTVVGSAHADGMPQRVYVTLPACSPEPFPYSETIEALRLELGHAGVEDVFRGAPPGLQRRAVHITFYFPCDPAAPAADMVLRTLGGETTHTLDLSDLPADVRARGLSLAVTELLRTAWPALLKEAEPDAAPPTPSDRAEVPLEEGAQPEPSPNPETPQPDPPQPEPQQLEPSTVPPSTNPSSLPRRKRHLELGSSAQVRVLVSKGTTLWGARPGISWWRFDGGVDLLFGTHSNALGRLNSRLVAGSLTVRVLQGRRDHWSGWVGPRVSLGTIVVHTTPEGEERKARDVRELYADVALPAGGGYQFGRCSLGGELEGGFARGFIARSSGSIVAVFGGVTTSVRLGMGCALW